MEWVDVVCVCSLRIPQQQPSGEGVRFARGYDDPAPYWERGTKVGY